MQTDNELVLRIDGARPVSAAQVEAVQRLCDRAEDRVDPGFVTVHLTGTPDSHWANDLSVGLVSKWERAVRRLERLPSLTVAVASGDCGGAALDVLLATDLRFATTDLVLTVSVDDEATWPGMSLYRLAQQVGTAGIRRAALLGAPIGAAEALALHLVDELVDDPEPALAAVAELAAPIFGKELAIRRQLMFDASSTSFEDALGSHLAACDRALRSGARQ